jgi:hypothetical protein
MEDFFQELEKDITNVGTDKVWKRTVGGKQVWFSPIPYDAQIQLNETLAREDLGNHAIQETKRLTLSHSIVGFGKFDLREYRDQYVFEVPDKKKKGAKVKVNLQKYVYHKIQKWDSDFTDVVFNVLADCLETNKKDTLKDVKFENLKEPIEELAEFEAKVHELRDQLNLPPLVEKGSERNTEEEASEAEEEASEAEDNSGPFDPFEAVENPEEAARNISVNMPSPESEPESPPVAQPSQPADRPAPVKSVPIPRPPVNSPEVSPIQRELQKRASKIGNTLDTAYVAQPSVNALVEKDKVQGVVEEPKANQPPVAPPKIDPPLGNKNPRFSPRK